MRLQLTRFALVAWIACTAAAGACATHREVASIDLRSSTYVDNDATTISTSTVAARGMATPEVTITARHLVDFTSSASVDVVTAATGRWTEYRNETEGGVSYANGTSTASVSYIYSTERDWTSNNLGIGVSRDFLQHNLTISLGGSWSGNDVGRADDANFQESLTTFGASAGVILVLAPTDIVSIGYTTSFNDGYQASPYRFVFFQDASAPGQVLSQAEVHPEQRLRHAVTGRWNHHLGRDAALRSHLRVYGDDWGLASLTGGTEYVLGLSESVEAAANVRGYAQQSAEFYEDVYPTRRKYMTADRELATFWDVFVGARLRWTGEVASLEQARAELRVVGFTFQFANFSRLPHREGALFEAAIGATF